MEMSGADDRRAGRRRFLMACPGSRTTARRSAAILVVFCLLGLATGATLSAAQTETPNDKALTVTLEVLDHAIHLLGDPSSNYRKVLLDAIAAFPSNADHKAEADIRTFLMRAPQPGGNFGCSVDFVRTRARKDLLRLRETLRNEYVPPVEPAVCYAAPFALDVTRAQTRGGWLDIYGYDFDRVTPEMVLVNREGGYQDVTAALVSRSHYHLALKLGDGAVRLSSESVSLGLTWGHLIHYSIAIIQPTSPLCSVRVETIPAGRTISNSPPRIAGERFPGRPGTKVWADASLDYSSNKLEATICMAATDHAGRGAVLSGCTVEFLYTTAPDRVIEAVFGALTSQVSYVRGNQTSDVKNGRVHSPVRQWAFGGFQPSGLDGGEISVTVRLDEIRLVSTEGEGCVSPMAYLEAQRTTVLDAVTRQSLDPQLRRIDPAILKLRPRFALPIPWRGTNRSY
jgi:hypothetical protein